MTFQLDRRRRCRQEHAPGLAHLVVQVLHLIGVRHSFGVRQVVVQIVAAQRLNRRVRRLTVRLRRAILG
eukprot:14831387-Heterocapsa_arctica.AAC.1